MNTTSTTWDESVHLLRRWKTGVSRMLGRHGFFRSRSHRLIAGVCGGLAERFDLPVGLVRFLFLVIALPGIVHAVIAYAILAILMPERDEVMGITV